MEGVRGKGGEGGMLEGKVNGGEKCEDGMERGVKRGWIFRVCFMRGYIFTFYCLDLFCFLGVLGCLFPFYPFILSWFFFLSLFLQNITLLLLSPHFLNFMRSFYVLDSQFMAKFVGLFRI